MICMLVLLVLFVGLRRHPQEQCVHATALSEKWLYYLLESDRKAGSIPIPTGVGVTCYPGKECIGPVSTTAKYVAYSETTVCPYLCIFYLSPVLGTSTVLPPLHQKGLLCLGRTVTCPRQHRKTSVPTR